MPTPDLSAVRQGFFESFLAQLPSTPTFESLQPAPQVLTGHYAEYAGAALAPLAGASITPQFVVRCDANGDGDSGAAAQSFALLWLIERLDVATDSEATMARILADFHAPNAGAAGAAGEPGGLAAGLAAAWAKALADDGMRSALARPLAEIAEVPPGLPATSLDELRSFLAHFGTYRADGAYYAKGAVEEGAFPGGVAAAYLAPDTGNVAEVRLQRDACYCYAIAAERLWSPQADAARFRQLVFRIEDEGEGASPRWRLALLHTVAARDAALGASRFVFFDAPVGLGLAVPDVSRSAFTAPAAALAEALPERLAALGDALADPLLPLVGSEQSPYVLLIGAVKAGFPSTPLPDGVIEDGDGAVRTFRCPPQHLMALAARDDIDTLEPSTPVWLDMQQARAEMNLAARTWPTGLTAADAGRGVVVGIVDSGIDGGHPAFLGRSDDATKSRIHSVWDMAQSGGDSPFKRSGDKAAYRSMNFGREYTGHDEVTTTQDYVDFGNGTYAPGHGTHVAGIAAGRAFAGWPGGVAPAATIVVAGTGSSGGYVNDVLAGVKYCFQKATELGLPCVVNISLGTERHPHDGSDPLSIGLTQLLSRDVVPATGLGTLIQVSPVYLPGRAVCAAAGNQRLSHTHWQATIPAGGEVSVLYRPFSTAATTRFAEDGVTFWAYNEDGTALRLRLSARHATNAVLATPEIGLRGSNAAVGTVFPGGLRVNLHNGPEAPNNRHFNPEIYWTRPAPAAAVPTDLWILRLRNTGAAACVVHGFSAFREKRGAFVFDTAQTQPLIGVTYTPDQLAAFDATTKVSTPGTAHGAITVAAYISRGNAGETVGDIAAFSSPGPLRAAAPGQRAIDCAMPGHRILSAKSWMPADTSRGTVDMSGTSMATPMMTGLVAAAFQQTPALTTGQLFNRIELAATRRPGDRVEDWGLGRVDAARFQA